MKTTETSLSGSGRRDLGAKPSDDDEACVDCLSALPNSVLLSILAGLGDAAAAGRTNVPSWLQQLTLLPELRFVPLSPDPGLIASALAGHEAELRHLKMTGDDPGIQDARGPRARGGMAPRRRAPHLRQDRLHPPGARDRERRRRRRRGEIRPAASRPRSRTSSGSARAEPVRAGAVLRGLGGELAAGAAAQAGRLHRTKAGEAAKLN